jgi:1-phosphofructokinase
VNLTVAEADGTTTKINEPGVPLDRAVLDRLGEAVLREAAGARWAVLSGSLPPGVPAGWYAELVAALATSGARVAVDTSGAPLRALLGDSPADGGGLPDLLKPNAEELAELVAVLDAQEPAAASSPADRVADLEADPAAAARAARRLVDLGVGAVLATLGSAGALLVTADGAWRATTAPVAARSTVGAGDSTLSGYLLADLAGVDAPGRLAHAVAYGAAAVQLPGSTVPTPADLREQLVTTTALAWEEAPAPAGSV